MMSENNPAVNCTHACMWILKHLLSVLAVIGCTCSSCNIQLKINMNITCSMQPTASTVQLLCYMRESCPGRQHHTTLIQTHDRGYSASESLLLGIAAEMEILVAGSNAIPSAGYKARTENKRRHCKDF